MPSFSRFCCRLTALLAPALFILPGAKAAPIISELMASNTVTLFDQDQDPADWVEIYNPDPVSVSLVGYYLTNKATALTAWEIPAVTLAPGADLVIFCSGKNYVDPTQPLAANFTLPSSGGYVALVAPDGKTVLSSYTFPIQYADVSYGISQPTGGGQVPTIGYFASATPGANNSDNSNILLADRVAISTPPQLFTGSVAVTLSGAGAGEHIRYQLATPTAAGDAQPAPSATSTLYTGPITITSSTQLRAAVFTTNDSQRGLPATAMYVQVDNSTANRLDTFTSNLPLVVYDDNGFGPLPDDRTFYPVWIAAFSVSANGSTSVMQTPDFFTPALMKDHGFSSALWPKQSFDANLLDDLGTSTPETFFGMNKDKGWDNISCWSVDLTYIHNNFVYTLWRNLGYWAPQIRYAEMFVHSGDGPLDYTAYEGVTGVTERFRSEPSRINIYALTPEDVTAPNLTGGYILRFDHPESSAGYYVFSTNEGQTLMIDTPKLDVLVPAQTAYITGYVLQMTDAMAADQAGGYATRNYMNYLDRPSWVDYHLLNVFVENDDAFLYSEYFTKDINGLMKAGPVWDYDRGMGSADGRDINPQQWTPYADGDYWNDSWWTYLTHDPDFMQLWIDRYQSLRLSTLSNNSMVALVNSLAAQIGPAAGARDEARWPANKSRYPGGWQGEVNAMASWLTARGAWVDQQFVSAPMVNVSGSQIDLVAPAHSTVVYTLDGSDPRLSGGAISPTAKLSSGAVTLPAGQTFLARTYDATQVGVYPGSPWSSPVNATSTTANNIGKLTNLSVRTQVGTGDNILIEGFVVTGPPGSAKQVLVRGVGPTLTNYGVSGVLSQPSLGVYNTAGILVAANTGWSTGANANAVVAAAAAVGAFSLPAGSADSALLLTLAPGAYTMEVSGVGGATGIALGEVYQITQDTSEIVDLSTRAPVGTNSATLISGFVIAQGSAEVLVRADGPALAQFGVTGALAQPLLQVYNGNGVLIASNTGWSANANAAQIAAAATAVGAFALTPGSADCALLLTVPAGSYTIHISGMGGATGSALAESYLVPSN